VLEHAHSNRQGQDVGVASTYPLVVATAAEQCLLESDQNGDGRASASLGLDEFLLWMGSEMGSEIDPALEMKASADIAKGGRRDSESSFASAGTTGAGAGLVLVLLQHNLW
jgi:hypothetical protein